MWTPVPPIHNCWWVSEAFKLIYENLYRRRFCDGFNIPVSFLLCFTPVFNLFHYNHISSNKWVISIKRIFINRNTCQMIKSKRISNCKREHRCLACFGDSSFIVTRGIKAFHCMRKELAIKSLNIKENMKLKKKSELHSIWKKKTHVNNFPKR